MATFDKLENVEEAAKRNPDTFFIPSLAERKNQQVGDVVRLHFLLKTPKEGEPGAERMWVRVTKRPGLLGSFRGVLENAPAYIEDLSIGDEVQFKPCHIARTVIKPNDPRWFEGYQKLAFVSKLCLQEGGCVRFLYREEADNVADSGWRMFSGHETDEYANNADNISLVEVGWMVDRDPSLLEPLKQGVGAVYERDGIGAGWRVVSDWAPFAE